VHINCTNTPCLTYRGADKSLARPGRKQAQKHVRDARDFNKIEKRAVVNFFFLQSKAPKEIHAILIETLAFFLPGRAKDLSATLYLNNNFNFICFNNNQHCITAGIYMLLTQTLSGFNYADKKLDWSVCTCLTQLYDGRNMYRFNYIKNYMFRHFTLAIA